MNVNPIECYVQPNLFSAGKVFFVYNHCLLIRSSKEKIIAQKIQELLKMAVGVTGQMTSTSTF